VEPKTVQDQKQGSYSTSKTFAKSREITANTQPNNYYMSKSTQKISMQHNNFHSMITCVHITFQRKINLKNEHFICDPPYQK